MIKYFKQKIHDKKSGFKITDHWDSTMPNGLYQIKMGYREEPYIKNDLDKLILDNPRNLEGELTLRTYRSWWGGFYKESLFSEFSCVKDRPGTDYWNFRVAHGRCIQWHGIAIGESGTDNKFRKGKYKKGKKTGKWKWWNPNGQIQAIGSFKKNKPVGEWKFYDWDGNIRDRTNINYFLRVNDSIPWKFGYPYFWHHHDFSGFVLDLFDCHNEDFDINKLASN